MAAAGISLALANIGPTLTIPGPREVMESSGMRAGQICLANEARFNSAFYSEEATNYIVGWRDSSNIQETLDFLFPPVLVGRRFEWKKAENAEQFLSETDDVRAIGSDFKHVEYKGSTVQDKTVNKGLTIVVDKDDTIAQLPGFENVIAARLKQRLLRNDLRRGITAASTAATDVAKTWNTTAGKDPDQDMLEQANLTADDSGVRASRLLMGETAWAKRVMAHRAQASAGGFGSADKTLDEVVAWLGMRKGMLSRERYQNAAATKAKIVPDIALFFYTDDNLSAEDPSNTKRFWSPVEGGGEWRVYIEPVGSKFIQITVEHYSNLVITSSLGLRKITVS